MLRTLAACLLVGVAGCSAGPELTSVSGVVRVDGEPMPRGTISFFPADGNRGPSAGAGIVDGRYEIEAEKGVKIGRNRVEIVGYRPTGRTITVKGVGGMPTVVDENFPLAGPEYNRETTLTAEIRRGHNVRDFELTAPKASKRP
jgi:hypothetical protein